MSALGQSHSPSYFPDRRWKSHPNGLKDLAANPSTFTAQRQTFAIVFYGKELGVKSLFSILLQNPPFLRFDERGAKFFALKSRINHIYFSRGCFDGYFSCSSLTRQVLRQNPLLTIDVQWLALSIWSTRSFRST